MKNLKIKIVPLLLLPLILVSACGNDDTRTPIIGDLITIAETGLYPEGIDFDTSLNRFVLGSIAKSEVGHVDTLTGTYTTFISDPALASVTGVFTDEIRNRLLVTSGNLGFSANSNVHPANYAYLGIYNLQTGILEKGIVLNELLSDGMGAFANDIAVDDAGDIFVTDSFSPVIYRVDGISLEASLFVDGGDDFMPAPMGFGLNGIVYNQGNLIVCKTDDGALFRIPISDPENFTKIEAPTFIGADGLEFTDSGDLIVVENGLGSNPGAKTLKSDNQWITAELVSSFAITAEKFPATATKASNGEIYVLNSYLGLILSGDVSRDTFEIVKIN